MGMNGNAEYLTPGDAALVLGCSAQAVRNAADEGRLRTAARTVGRQAVRLFTRSEVERFRRVRDKAGR